MSKHTPFSVLRFSREAVTFLRKQPALWPVVVLFIGLPSFAMTLAGRLVEENGPLAATSVPRFFEQNDPQGYSLVIAVILLILLTIWGGASVLVVGRRMIGNRAGRARTSAMSVIKETAPLVFPIFFTSVIQMAQVLLWLLPAAVVGFILFILPLLLETTNSAPFIFILFPVGTALAAIPGILFLIRSSLYSVAIIAEDFRLNMALRRSKELVQGYFWITVRCYIGFLILFVLPPMILELALEQVAQSNVSTLLVVDFIVNMIRALSTAPLLLATVLLFGALRDAPRSVRI